MRHLLVKDLQILRRSPFPQVWRNPPRGRGTLIPMSERNVLGGELEPCAAT